MPTRADQVQPIAFNNANHFVAAHRDGVLRPAFSFSSRAFSHERIVAGEASTSALIRSVEAFSRISFRTGSDRMATSNRSLLRARAELSRGVGIHRDLL
jgi:hypothetical protein